jgi:hypothetical protein
MGVHDVAPGLAASIIDCGDGNGCRKRSPNGNPVPKKEGIASWKRKRHPIADFVPMAL